MAADVALALATAAAAACMMAGPALAATDVPMQAMFASKCAGAVRRGGWVPQCHSLHVCHFPIDQQPPAPLPVLCSYLNVQVQGCRCML